jgi:hypothetical protein
VFRKNHSKRRSEYYRALESKSHVDKANKKRYAQALEQDQTRLTGLTARKREVYDSQGDMSYVIVKDTRYSATRLRCNAGRDNGGVIVEPEEEVSESSLVLHSQIKASKHIASPYVEKQLKYMESIVSGITASLKEYGYGKTANTADGNNDEGEKDVPQCRVLMMTQSKYGHLGRYSKRVSLSSTRPGETRAGGDHTKKKAKPRYQINTWFSGKNTTRPAPGASEQSTLGGEKAVLKTRPGMAPHSTGYMPRYDDYHGNKTGIDKVSNYRNRYVTPTHMMYNLL